MPFGRDYVTAAVVRKVRAGLATRLTTGDVAPYPIHFYFIVGYLCDVVFTGLACIWLSAG